MCVLCRAFGSELQSYWHGGAATGSDAGKPVPAFASSAGQAATGNQDVDGLLSGTRWSGTVTYSFPDSASDYPSGYGSGEPTAAGFGQVSAAQQQAVHTVMAQIEAFTNVNIDFAGTNGADIRLAQSSAANPTAYAYYPSGSFSEGGDVWFGTSYDYGSPKLGDYSYATIIHELGHSFGLKHSHEVGGVAGAVPSNHDALEFSVMSYRSYVGGSTSGGYTNENFGYPQSYMMNDIAALQEMYGADFNTNNSNSVYTFSPTTGQMSINGVGQGTPGANRVFLTVWDGGGKDTYDFSAYSTAVTIDLRPASFSTTSATQKAYLGDGHYAQGNVYNSYLYHGDARSYIENAVGGSGNDTLIGNAVANKLNGGGGADKMTGGAGNDTYVVNNSGDVADETGGGSGTDTVLSSITFSLSSATSVKASVENLTLAGSFAINATGNALANVLTGNSGNNILTGMKGADTLVGGSGIDTASYKNDTVGVTVNLALSGGQARGEAAGDLLSGMENVTGGKGADILTGNALSNKLAGGAGADTIIGGRGNDTCVGGTGGDTFVFDLGFGKDKVTDFAGGAGTGHDMIEFDLSLFANFASMLTHASEAGGNVVIAFDAANTLTLQSTSLSHLVADDFRFV
jgi:serralysin